MMLAEKQFELSKFRSAGSAAVRLRLVRGHSANFDVLTNEGFFRVQRFLIPQVGVRSNVDRNNFPSSRSLPRSGY